MRRGLSSDRCKSFILVHFSPTASGSRNIYSLSQRSVYSNAPTLTPSPAVSPSIINADDSPNCVLNSLDERASANSPDSTRLSPHTEANNGVTTTNAKNLPTVAYENNSTLLVAPECVSHEPHKDSPASTAENPYTPNFGRQRITDVPRISPKGLFSICLGAM